MHSKQRYGKNIIHVQNRDWLPQPTQRCSKIAPLPRWPKIGPRWSKMAPRWPQDAPEWNLGGYTSKRTPKAPVAIARVRPDPARVRPDTASFWSHKWHPKSSYEVLPLASIFWSLFGSIFDRFWDDFGTILGPKLVPKWRPNEDAKWYVWYYIFDRFLNR